MKLKFFKPILEKIESNQQLLKNEILNELNKQTNCFVVCIFLFESTMEK